MDNCSGLGWPVSASLWASLCFSLCVLAVWCEVSQGSEYSSVEPAAAAAPTTRLQPSSTECLQEGEQLTHDHTQYSLCFHYRSYITKLICDSRSWCARTCFRRLILQNGVGLSACVLCMPMVWAKQTLILLVPTVLSSIGFRADPWLSRSPIISWLRPFLLSVCISIKQTDPCKNAQGYLTEEL